MIDKQHDLFFSPSQSGVVYLSPDTGALISHLATRRESLKKKKKKTDRKISAKNLSLEYIPVLLYTNLQLHERKQKATSRHCSGSNPSYTCSPARPTCRLSCRTRSTDARDCLFGSRWWLFILEGTLSNTFPSALRSILVPRCTAQNSNTHGLRVKASEPPRNTSTGVEIK